MKLSSTPPYIKYFSFLFFLALFGLNSQSLYAWCIPNCLPGVVQISAGSDCESTIYANQVLSNYQYNCSYQVTVFSPSGAPMGNTVPSYHMNKVLNYSVYSGGTVCMGSLKVIDNHAPIAVCDLSTNVSLGSDGTARVYVSAFDDGSYDNCGLESVKIARKVAGNCPYGVKSDTEFRDYVEVCCNDIYHSPLMIELKATDYAGNTNICWSLLTVEDKLTPTIICPPDITVNCEFEFDPHYLSVFGKVVSNSDDRDLIEINDPNYAPTYVAGIDGIATGACGVTITETNYDNLDCGIGTILRTFSATTQSGMVGSCTQKINFVPIEKFDEKNIIWPDPMHLTSCPDGKTDPSYTGKPTYINQKCSKPLASYKDLVFTIVEDACFKILRRWTVIDCCYFDPNAEPPVGMWTYTQVIKVESIDGPKIENCEPLVIHAKDVIDCSGYVELTNSAMDECTPDSLLKWSYVIEPEPDDLDYIIGQGNDASGYYPFGTHTIIWTVEDLCGNKRVCEQEFTVKDSKQPTPVCYHGLSSVVMPVSGQITLPASVFDANSFDNCTDRKDLEFSYTDELADSLKTFTCDNLDTNFVEIHVFDESGNSDFCKTYIVLRDNYFVCADSLMTFTAGMVTDIHGEPVENVKINYQSEFMPGVYEVSSWFNGYYELEWYGVHSGTDGVVSAYKRDDYLNGVTTLDLLLIQQHILGNTPFRSNTEIIAADINRDGLISVEDLVEGQQLILGKILELRDNDSWLVYPAGKEVFRSAIEDTTFSTETTIKVFEDEIILVNFDAIKVGDVNFSAIGAPKVTSERSISSTDIFYKLDQSELENRFKFYMNSGDRAHSLQFSLELNVEPHQITSVEFDQQLELNWNYNVMNGDDPGTTAVVISVYDEDGFTFSEHAFLEIQLDEEVHYTSAGDIRLIDFPARPEIAMDINHPLSLQLELLTESDVSAAGVQNLVLNTYPNPSGHMQFLEVYSKMEGTAEVKITDALGRLIHSEWVNLVAGNNEFSLESGVFENSGLYFISISDQANGEKSIVKVLRF